MEGKIENFLPLAVLFPPDKNLSVITSRCQNIPVLGMRPRYTPNSSFVSIGTISTRTEPLWVGVKGIITLSMSPGGAGIRHQSQKSLSSGRSSRLPTSGHNNQAPHHANRIAHGQRHSAGTALYTCLNLLTIISSWPGFGIVCVD